MLPGVNTVSADGFCIARKLMEMVHELHLMGFTTAGFPYTYPPGCWRMHLYANRTKQKSYLLYSSEDGSSIKFMSVPVTNQTTCQMMACEFVKYFNPTTTRSPRFLETLWMQWWEIMLVETAPMGVISYYSELNELVTVFNIQRDRTFNIPCFSPVVAKCWTKHQEIHPYIANVMEKISSAARLCRWDELIQTFRLFPLLQNTCSTNEPSLFTPLHYAAYYNADKNVVKNLMRLGADKLIKNRDGKTAVMVAKDRGYHDLAQCIDFFER